MSNHADWHPLYPFPSHEVILGGHRCHYVDEGSGPVLLAVHGNPTWSFYWRNLILGLREKYRIVAIDQIGCGLSEKPDSRTYSFRLAERVANLREFIETLGLEKITLVAHDWGGAVGMGAAAARPDRFSRFVLMNTAAFRAARCPWRIRVCRTPLLGRLAVQGLNLFARAALHMAVAKHDRMTAAVRSGLLAPYDSWRHRRAVHEFVADIPLTPRHPSYATLSRIEAGLSGFRTHPVCLVWGMQDWCFGPWFLDRFLDYFPQAEVHRLADAGHYVVEDAHERIVPIVDAFVTKHPADRADQYG